MKLKVGSVEVAIPGWALLISLLVADNMYANHCKKKAGEKLLETLGEEGTDE